MTEVGLDVVTFLTVVGEKYLCVGQMLYFTFCQKFESGFVFSDVF